jgi:endogenous inhibitor of DNA gyrase (YacG/DUF329 family)
MTSGIYPHKTKITIEDIEYIKKWSESNNFKSNAELGRELGVDQSAIQYHRKKISSHFFIRKKCENCGNEFETNRLEQRFCCPKCEIHHREFIVKSAFKERLQNTPKVCPICHKSFTCKKSLKQKFCSILCRKTFRRIHREKLKERTKVCKQCGTEFTTIIARKIFCSRHCACEWSHDQRIRTTEIGIKKMCINCGKEFIAMAISNVACPECRKLKGRPWMHKPLIKKTCKECGKEFETSRDKLFCSRRCKEIDTNRLRSQTQKFSQLGWLKKFHPEIYREYLSWVHKMTPNKGFFKEGSLNIKNQKV